MTFTIDGTDITQYMAYEGLKYTVYDLDSEDTTRNLNGTLIRHRVATKVRWDIPCKPLTTTQLQTLLQLLAPASVQVTASDPMFGLRTGTFYSNNNNMSLVVSSTTSSGELWSGFTFPLIEM